MRRSERMREGRAAAAGAATFFAVFLEAVFALVVFAMMISPERLKNFSLYLQHHI
jgi:hypothetical protein